MGRGMPGPGAQFFAISLTLYAPAACRKDLACSSAFSHLDTGDSKSDKNSLANLKRFFSIKAVEQVGRSHVGDVTAPSAN